MKKILLIAGLILLAAVGVSQAETQVSRIAVAKEIVAREPAEVNNIFKSDVGQIYCFTEITTDQAPTSVVHVWQYEGKTVAEVPLRVGANRWRTYSSKKLDSNWQGNWKVEVFSDKGVLLESTEFIVLE